MILRCGTLTGLALSKLLSGRFFLPVPRRTGPRIAVVGSYATGLTMKVERMPSTGETLLGTGYRVDYGGKGSNQAVACARLGASVSFVAKIGMDPSAKWRSASIATKALMSRM